MRDIEIRGGASEFEAAIVGVVLDHIAADESRATERRRRKSDARLPAWVRAALPEPPDQPLDVIKPD